mmetsp:Transcript_18292/g.33128  ORF Transcript_18292/g.33128 Transcript_18292/m.33128 type:complete len:251 (+) Transcript_18292:175-927(+)
MASTLTYYPSLPQSLLPLFLWSWLLLLHSENVASFSSGRRFYHGRTCCSSSSSVTHKITIIISTLQSPRGGEPLHHPISSTTNTVMMHAKSKATEEEVVVTLIHSHHLLDHKPDNMILTGKKFKLRGIACLGRPGVALCIGSPSNVKKFTNKLRGAMPQKKFGVVDIIKEVAEDTNAVSILDEVVDGFEEASLGELRELLTAVGREDQFLALVGIDNNSANGNSNSDKGNSNGSVGSKSASGTNKRKKRG